MASDNQVAGGRKLRNSTIPLDSALEERGQTKAEVDQFLTPVSTKMNERRNNPAKEIFNNAITK
jgi:hypothetical protein